MSTNCHECGHSIDAHHQDDDAQIDACWEPIYAVFSFGVQECACQCQLKPSQIAARLNAAETWVQRIDRDALAVEIALTPDPSHAGMGTRHVGMNWAREMADAVLAALPELMGGEQR